MTYKNGKVEYTEPELNFQSYTELPNNHPLVIVDVDMRIVYCNDAFRNNFNLDVHDEISKMKTNPEFVYLIRGFSSSRYKNITIDINLSSEADLTIKNYSVSIERVLIKSTPYYVLTIESLEQRKKLENRINALHNALDHGNVPIIILDSEYRVSYVTKTFEDLIGKEIEMIYYQSINEVLKGVIDASDLEGLNDALINQQVWKRIIAFNKTKPLSFWEFSLNPVSSSNSKEQKYILIANNLTEHISQTKVIERSERKQKLIINNISDLLLIVEHANSKTYFENANDNFCRIFNIDKNRNYSALINEILPNSLYNLISVSINEISNRNLSGYSFEYNHNERRQFSCKVTSIFEREKNSTIYIITLADITDELEHKKQLQRAYQKEMLLNKMKSDFLANMSHEIRTPFNAISGFSEIIDESIELDDMETIKELMDSMKEVLGRALNLFTNIVEVSQIEAGEVELDKVELNCNQVVRNVYNKNAGEVEKKHLEFRIDLEQEDCVVEIDWIKLEKIIDSVVENSIKYTHTGFICLSTRIENGHVNIVINDSGVGIEQSQIDRVLKPFSQEVEGYTRPFEGAGLGLTIAYKLTRLMNGTFEIITEKNKGTKIVIAFPLINTNGGE